MFIPTNGREKNKQQQLSGIMLHVTASKWRGKDDQNISPPEKKYLAIHYRVGMNDKIKNGILTLGWLQNYILAYWLDYILRFWDQMSLISFPTFRVDMN